MFQNRLMEHFRRKLPKIHEIVFHFILKVPILKKSFFSLFILLSVIASAQNKMEFNPKTVFETKDLVVIQITPHVYQHISYLKTNDYGNVPCNGLIVTNNNEAVVFDTPTNDSSSDQLIQWISTTLKSKVNAIVPSHFHNDCLGGLKAFHTHAIPSIANNKTIELAKSNKFEIPNNGFNDSTIIKVGQQFILLKHFGEGHTIDNVVAYFPSEQVLFGGCLIKELDASKGYLGDANVKAWSNTVTKIKKAYPKLQIVVPGHGAIGNQALLDYTIKLFNQL
jgi:metallo-beta-lactamase class B